jgi:hypothetical protein
MIDLSEFSYVFIMFYRRFYFLYRILYTISLNVSKGHCEIFIFFNGSQLNVCADNLSSILKVGEVTLSYCWLMNLQNLTRLNDIRLKQSYIEGMERPNWQFGKGAMSQRL